MMNTKALHALRTKIVEAHAVSVHDVVALIDALVPNESADEPAADPANEKETKHAPSHRHKGDT